MATEPKGFKKEEIQAVISAIDIDKPEKKLAHFFIFLILMPLSGVCSLGILTYFLEGTPFQFISAFLFVFSFCGWVTLWVLRHLQKLRKDYEKQMALLNQMKTTNKKEELNKRALFVQTKSSVIYVLIVGYLAISFGFALVYDAMHLTTAFGFWNNVYFSISTVTTIGYGDIVPIQSGRFFASFQMIYGILYQVLAVSIGTTYLIHITQKHNNT